MKIKCRFVIISDKINGTSHEDQIYVCEIYLTRLTILHTKTKCTFVIISDKIIGTSHEHQMYVCDNI
jgi:hypothetical protein